MNAQQLLQEICDYCRQTGLAESTFGRRAVNDGKLAARLRNGGRITTDTLDRIHGFMAAHPARAGHVPSSSNGARRPRAALPAARRPRRRPAGDPQRNFRFFDNRQKYLLFVNTCSEKWEVAIRVSEELAHIHPRPPAVRVFDAGVGDGSVLVRVMRAMHDRFAHMPFYVVGKEISLEDVRLTLQKMSDRFFEHPATVLVLTNLAYADAPWLRSNRSMPRRAWSGTSCRSPAIPPIASSSKSSISNVSWRRIGKPASARAPAIRSMSARSCSSSIAKTIASCSTRSFPGPAAPRANYDLVIASQPYRARAPLEFKAKRVIAPLARALGPGGRLIAIHSHGQDPGMEIIQKVWPDDHPFIHDRHQILKAVKHELGPAGRDLNFNAYADNRSLFRYVMHTLPSEISESIGTSTLFAAWNAAIYVAQVEDDRLGEVVADGRYIDATRAVLRERGGLWFFDESYVISRRRG